MLTRDFLDNVPKPGAPEKLHVKAWGLDVWVADPTCDMVDEWEAFCERHTAPDKTILPGPWRATLASILLCDESGKRLYTADDVPLLGEQLPEALKEIWSVGIKKLKADTDQEIEEKAKN